MFFVGLFLIGITSSGYAQRGLPGGEQEAMNKQKTCAMRTDDHPVYS